MKVLHFILGKVNKQRANGVNQVVAGLAKYCARLGAEVRVIGLSGGVSPKGESINRDGFVIKVFPEWNNEVALAISKGVSWADVVHLHAVYAPYNIKVAKICDQVGTPYVITPHNGLCPVLSQQKSTGRKWLFHWLIQKRHLEGAAAIHALSEEEATDVLRYCNPNNMFCIPNGIDLDDYPVTSLKKHKEAAPWVVGFLGRISYEKNLDTLCQAFVAISESHNIQLKLAGPTTSAYSRNVADRFPDYAIDFVGPLFGQEKDDFIRGLDLLVLPSISEGSSIAAIEALALGTPLLVTRGCKLNYLFDRHAFYLCEPTKFGLERGLANAIDNRVEWPSMIKNARDLVEEKLNWSSVAREMLDAYRSTLEGSK